MKATEVTPPGSESHSSAPVESDDLVSCGTNCHTSPHGVMATKSEVPNASVCSSTTESCGQPVEPRKKRRRRGEMQMLLDEDRTLLEFVDRDTVQRKETRMKPLVGRLKNHSDDKVPDSADSPCISSLPYNEMPGPQPASAANIEAGGPVVRKTKRRWQRKDVSENTGAASALYTNANNISTSTRRLRSRREGQPSVQDGKIECGSKVFSDPLENIKSNMLNVQGIKRRRPKADNQRVPAKVSRLDVSPEASSALITDTDLRESAETDKLVELNTDKQDTDTDGGGGQLSLQSEEPQEQQPEEKECTLTQAKPFSFPAAEPEVPTSESVDDVNSSSTAQNDYSRVNADMSCSSEAQTKDSIDSPQNENLQNTESSGSETLTSSEVLTESVADSAMKTENVEFELDHLNPESNGLKSFQCHANTAASSEGLSIQKQFFRRKKGGKRRRRRSNVLLQMPHIEEKEGNMDAQQNTDAGDVDIGDSSSEKVNAVYTKKGGKIVLNCGYCGQIFKFMSQFIIHQRVHTGERPFKCTECGKGFSKNSNLNLHLKTHRKSNVYQKCTVCDQKFPCSEYASHMKLHAHVTDRENENKEPEKRSAGSDREKSLASPEKKETQVCQYCGKSFRFPSALIRHVRVHTGEKPYKCDICGKAFGQAYFLRVHELTHWSVKRYNCTRCGKSFTHYSNARNHTCRPLGSNDALLPNRRLKPSLTFTCHICKNVFDSLQEFNGHMRAHTGAKLYRCLYCDKLFGVLSEFSSHCSHCKGGRITPSSEVKEENKMSLIEYSVPPRRSSSAPPLTATKCEIRKSHSPKKRANLKKPFQSTVIPAHPLSHLVSTLNKLDNRSDPRKYLCPSCGRLFRHMGRLRAHMLTHAPGQSYTCACCGKTLESWNKLWHHQRIHRQRRGRFACPQCGRGFRFVEQYKKHMSEHPDFQWIQVRPKKAFLPYQCEQCRSRFKTLDLLFSHQLCHSSTHKDSDFDLCIDDNQSNKKILKLRHTKNHTESEENNLNPSSKYPDLASRQLPLTSQYSSVQNQSLDLGKTSHHPGSKHSDRTRQSSHDSKDENCVGKPVSPFQTVKRHGNQNASISNKGSSDGVNCAVCGSTYAAISDLYHHYVQHARGEV